MLPWNQHRLNRARSPKADDTGNDGHDARNSTYASDQVRHECAEQDSTGVRPLPEQEDTIRRAFPKCYTWCLEERVRVLESEVRELKDLLDEKDEKIDMLSRMHSNGRAPDSFVGLSQVIVVQSPEPAAPTDDTFRVQAWQALPDAETSSESAFIGASTGRAFATALQRKLRENGMSCSGFNPAVFFEFREDHSASQRPASYKSSVPPRLFSDRCVNIFWQEHAPLFPVLHKLTFLKLYEEYVANPEAMVDNHKLAILHLVFCIAGVSSALLEVEDIAHCEDQWRNSLNAILLEGTLSTLQCLVLACLYFSQTEDYHGLHTYKAIAVGLSQRLGLHQSQKHFIFGALTIETRKKVFWTLYTIDCFSAASMGLPQLLRDSDIQAEYPLAIDDEYVEEKGYLPTLPGESSKILSALALFRASRIVSRILQKLYPTDPSQDLSLQTMATLGFELDEWSENLPQHLKLAFVQDKPSTDVTGSHSALLSLAYYHIRSLLHRVAIGSTLGDKASPSAMSLADSSKHLIQIIQLLEERSMSFSFCISKTKMLTLCGLSILYQSLDLKIEGTLLRDGQRLVREVSAYLDKLQASGAAEFKNLVISLSPPTPSHIAPALPDRGVLASVGAPYTKSTPSPSLPRHMSMLISRRYSAQSRIDSERQQQQERIRRATMHSTTIPVAGLGCQGVDSNQDSGSVKKANSMGCRTPKQTLLVNRGANENDNMIRNGNAESAPQTSMSSDAGPNLDYFSLQAAPPSEPPKCAQGRSSSTHSFTPSYTPHEESQFDKPPFTPSEWNTVVSSLVDGTSNIFDAVYGRGVSGAAGLNTPVADAGASGVLEGGAYGEWDADTEAWEAAAMGLTGEFDVRDSAPQSVLSFSEENLSSGDNFAGDFSGSMMIDREGFYLTELDTEFGLP
ncbi:hypothetical protein V493_00131 [Pseudogymnoascus sp. VKM F-4281 (FW-2241)]|nr:hypothetical protein V493_00131 [Pseudogymnoascus sp. VKM F-4281 (FW-2241)]